MSSQSRPTRALNPLDLKADGLYIVLKKTGMEGDYNGLLAIKNREDPATAIYQYERTNVLGQKWHAMPVYVSEHSDRLAAFRDTILVKYRVGSLEGVKGYNPVPDMLRSDDLFKYSLKPTPTSREWVEATLVAIRHLPELIDRDFNPLTPAVLTSECEDIAKFVEAEARHFTGPLTRAGMDMDECGEPARFAMILRMARLILNLDGKIREMSNLSSKMVKTLKG